MGYLENAKKFTAMNRIIRNQPESVSMKAETSENVGAVQRLETRG
jgi:hypothetical protein